MIINSKADNTRNW